MPRDTTGRDSAKFVVHRLDRHTDFVRLSSIGGVNRRMNLAHDRGHHVGDGGKKQFATSLLQSGFVEHRIQPLGRKHVFQGRSNHDTHRRLFFKPFNNVSQDHRITSLNYVNFKYSDTLPRNNNPTQT